jgi:hypothetical protein
MSFSTVEILLITSGVIGTVLTVTAAILVRRGLFRWTTFGFWTWASFALYFFINPMSSVITGNLTRYTLFLGLAGESERGIWILLVTVTGILAFFILYLNTDAQPITWRLSTDGPQFNTLMVYFTLLIVSFSFYSLIAYRSGLFETDIVIRNGRFVGSTSAYSNVGYTFVFVPTMILLLSKPKTLRLAGWFIIVTFVVLTLPKGWARFATVSILIASSIAVATKNQKSYPPIWLVLSIAGLASVLQIRGHVSWELFGIGDEFQSTASLISERGLDILAGNDSAMLASWYLKSFVDDKITGYDYGIPLLNYALFGWIPYRFFPQKYFLVDWLRASQTTFPPEVGDLLNGAKYTLLGSFYSNGGIVAVIVMSAITGWMCRKMDGMLYPDNPVVIRALGISWLSMMWMIWGSSDYWGLIRIGSLAIPVLLIWLLAPKQYARRHSTINSKDSFKAGTRNFPDLNL